MEQEQQLDDDPRDAERRAAEATNEALRASYVRVLSGAAHKHDLDVFLQDLGGFCRAHESTGHPDPYVAARLDGRREVWLRMQRFANLDMAVLMRLFFDRKV